MSIKWQQVLLFAFALLCYTAKLVFLTVQGLPRGINWNSPYGINWPVVGAGVLGGTLGTFLLAGIIPLIVWAFLRFRSSAANAVIRWWAILIVAVTLLPR
jgi:hypothetical protein